MFDRPYKLVMKDFSSDLEKEVCWLMENAGYVAVGGVQTHPTWGFMQAMVKVKEI